MQALNLFQSNKSFLTATVPVADPNKPGDTIFVGYPCTLKGERLGPNDQPIPVYRDLYTGKSYARVAENIPTATDAASVEAAKEITALNPIHYCSDDGSVKGWFIEAPNFDQSVKAVAA